MVPLSLRRVSKKFGAVTAVDHVNLDVNGGEFLVVVGESGCGKTTTLRLIAGLESPDSGTIFINGAPVNDVSVGRRGVQMIFQNFALWPHLTVADNVAFGLNVRKVSREDRARQVELALKMVHMEEYAARKPTQLSGGQQQRVALARALVIQPTVLLLDENPRSHRWPPHRHLAGGALGCPAADRHRACAGARPPLLPNAPSLRGELGQ